MSTIFNYLHLFDSLLLQYDVLLWHRYRPLDDCIPPKNSTFPRRLYIPSANMTDLSATNRNDCSRRAWSTNWNFWFVLNCGKGWTLISEKNPYSFVVGLILILHSTLPDSNLLAMVTLCPNRQYLGIFLPTTPASTVPVWIPILIWNWFFLIWDLKFVNCWTYYPYVLAIMSIMLRTRIDHL